MTNQWGTVQEADVARDQLLVINQIRGILRIIESRTDVVAISFHVEVEDGRLLAGNAEENVVGFDFGQQPSLYALHCDAMNDIVGDMFNQLYGES